MGLQKSIRKDKVSYMTSEAFAWRLKEMSDDQNRALEILLPILDASFMSQVKLCGGTALSRFYLQHRISYDLDFFVPEEIGFNSQSMADLIASKTKIHGLELTSDDVKANQLHFFLPMPNGSSIKVSFVEDMYAKTFPPVNSVLEVAGRTIVTESVEGLYHRKLRTVVGWADAHAQYPAGGRQTARDMFDLYVLSQVVKPLEPFIDSLPYAFPFEAFVSGMAAMPWFDLKDELEQTIASPNWQQGKFVDVIKNHLFSEISMNELPENFEQDHEEASRAKPNAEKPR